MRRSSGTARREAMAASMPRLHSALPLFCRRCKDHRQIIVLYVGWRVAMAASAPLLHSALPLFCPAQQPQARKLRDPVNNITSLLPLPSHNI